MSNIGLFFGSFNPVHTGHLLIASYMADHAGLDAIWFVISPQNPLKAHTDLLNENDRRILLQLAIENDDRFVICDAEFDLPRPSYTINTLNYLAEKYPSHKFTLIVGGDNLVNFHQWRSFDTIVENYDVFVYRRNERDQNIHLANGRRVRFFDVPLLNISSTYIREMIRARKSIRYLVPDKVMKYITEKHLYL
jgi:nicotinate-nucleotide adenylyltransferase